MRFEKFLSKIKPMIVCLIVMVLFLTFDKFAEEYLVSNYNTDYSIRDYLLRTANNPNYGIWRQKIDSKTAKKETTHSVQKKEGSKKIMKIGNPESQFENEDEDFIFAHQKILKSPNVFSLNHKFWKNFNNYKSRFKGDARLLLDSNLSEIINSKFENWNSAEMQILLKTDIHSDLEISSFIMYSLEYDSKRDIINFYPQDVEVRIIPYGRMIFRKRCMVDASMSLVWHSQLKRYKQILEIFSHDCESLNLIIEADLQSGAIVNFQISSFFLKVLVFFLFSMILIYNLKKSLQAKSNLRFDLNSYSLGSLIYFCIKSTIRKSDLLNGFWMHHQKFKMIFILLLLQYIFLTAVCYFYFFDKSARNQDDSNVSRENLEYSLIPKSAKKRDSLFFVFFFLAIAICGEFFEDAPLRYFPIFLALLIQIWENGNSKRLYVNSQQHFCTLGFYFLCFSIIYDYSPYNFYSLSTAWSENSFLEASILIILFMCLTSIIFLQEENDPSFLICEKFKPHKSMFDYFNFEKNFSPEEMESLNEETCCICYEEINKPPENYLDPENGTEISENQKSKKLLREREKNEISEILKKTRASCKKWKKTLSCNAKKSYIKRKLETEKRMMTPCKHFFHSKCLLLWMGRKFECPMCKKELPCFE